MRLTEKTTKKKITFQHGLPSTGDRDPRHIKVTNTVADGRSMTDPYGTGHCEDRDDFCAVIKADPDLLRDERDHMFGAYAWRAEAELDFRRELRLVVRASPGFVRGLIFRHSGDYQAAELRQLVRMMAAYLHGGAMTDELEQEITEQAELGRYFPIGPSPASLLVRQDSGAEIAH
jgi:hypothetical protein